MKKNHFYISALLIIVALFACNRGKKDKENANKRVQLTVDYKLKGRAVADSAQAGLFVHLGSALRKGGVPYAVEYCNLKAVPIVDSLSKKYNCAISRVSDKNRNPANALSEGPETDVWNDFKKKLYSKKLQDTTIIIGSDIIYYKAIRTNMPTCLSCHGDPESYIQKETLSKINELYPGDRARNYKLNELRGLWKIEFENAD